MKWTWTKGESKSNATSAAEAENSEEKAKTKINLVTPASAFLGSPRLSLSRLFFAFFSPESIIKKKFQFFHHFNRMKAESSSSFICRVYAKSDLFKFSLRLCSLWLFACILRVITREEKTKSEKLGKSLKSDVPRSHWQIKDENRQHNDSAICCEKVFVSRFENRSVRSVRRFGTVWGRGLIEKRYLPFYFRVSVFNMR